MKVPHFDEPTHLETLIVSPGGVGSAILMRWLPNVIRTNNPNNKDWMKHMSSPDLIPDNVTIDKGIFIIGSPIAAVLSIARRGWLRQQAQYVSGKKNKLGTLDEFLDCGRDIFEYREQLNRWTSGLSFPVLLIKYPDFYPHWKEIADYTGVDPDAHPIPAFKDRPDRFAELTQEQQTKMTEIYGELEEEIQALPPLKLIPAR